MRRKHSFTWRCACREMLTDLPFTMTVGQSYIALPARFLDPIGRIQRPSINLGVRHKDSNFIQATATTPRPRARWGRTRSRPRTARYRSRSTCRATGSIRTRSSTPAGATFNGVTINGTFPIDSITDANNFTIDISVLGTTPNASGAGGGAAVAYICDNLVAGIANWFGIWNERIYFDTAFVQTTICKLQYFQSLPLLSSSNQSNFLTNRYPQLMRVALMAAAADFMQDSEEFQKHETRLVQMIQAVSVENDMMLRGMELDTEIPSVTNIAALLAARPFPVFPLPIFRETPWSPIPSQPMGSVSSSWAPATTTTPGAPTRIRACSGCWPMPSPTRSPARSPAARSICRARRRRQHRARCAMPV
jgi:hypothetical protein